VLKVKQMINNNVYWDNSTGETFLESNGQKLKLVIAFEGKGSGVASGYVGKRPVRIMNEDVMKDVLPMLLHDLQPSTTAMGLVKDLRSTIRASKTEAQVLRQKLSSAEARNAILTKELRALKRGIHTKAVGEEEAHEAMLVKQAEDRREARKKEQARQRELEEKTAGFRDVTCIHELLSIARAYEVNGELEKEKMVIDKLNTIHDEYREPTRFVRVAQYVKDKFKILIS